MWPALPHLLGLLSCVLSLVLTCVDSTDFSGKQGSSGFSGCQLKCSVGGRWEKSAASQSNVRCLFKRNSTGVSSLDLCLASSLPQFLHFPSVRLQTFLPGSSLDSTPLRGCRQMEFHLEEREPSHEKQRKMWDLHQRAERLGELS